MLLEIMKRRIYPERNEAIWTSCARRILRLYDELPIAFAVYRMLLDEERRVRDAVVFYVNRKFEERMGRSSAELLGGRTRELFPTLGEAWYERAGRAALTGEIITGRLYCEPIGKDCYMTASQVIHPGYCSVTYQEIDLFNTAEQK